MCYGAPEWFRRQWLTDEQNARSSWLKRYSWKSSLLLGLAEAIFLEVFLAFGSGRSDIPGVSSWRASLAKLCYCTPHGKKKSMLPIKIHPTPNKFIIPASQWTSGLSLASGDGQQAQPLARSLSLHTYVSTNSKAHSWNIVTVHH